MSQYDIDLLKGKTLTKATYDELNDIIKFHRSDGVVVGMFHDQDCCESVWCEDICGDLKDLVGSEILMAHEASSDDPQYQDKESEWGDITTWTFYKIATAKGYVTIRWCGESNGYYSTTPTVRTL